MAKGSASFFSAGWSPGLAKDRQISFVWLQTITHMNPGCHRLGRKNGGVNHDSTSIFDSEMDLGTSELLNMTFQKTAMSHRGVESFRFCWRAAPIPVCEFTARKIWYHFQKTNFTRNNFSNNEVHKPLLHVWRTAGWLGSARRAVILFPWTWSHKELLSLRQKKKEMCADACCYERESRFQASLLFWKKRTRGCAKHSVNINIWGEM